MDRCSLVQMGKTKARSGDEICLETLSEVLPVGLRSYSSSAAPFPPGPLWLTCERKELRYGLSFWKFVRSLFLDQPSSVLSRLEVTKKYTEIKSWIHLHVKKSPKLKSLSAESRRPSRNQPSRS